MRGRWERGEQWYQRGHTGPRRLIVAVASDVFVGLHSTGVKMLLRSRTYRLECGHETGVSSGGHQDLATLRRKLSKRPRCAMCGRDNLGIVFPTKPVGTTSLALDWRFAKETLVDYPSAIVAVHARYLGDDDVLIDSYTEIREPDGEVRVCHFALPDQERQRVCEGLLY